MNRKVIAWGPAILWAVCLFLLSEVQEAPPGLQGILNIPDKLVHFVLYFTLGGLLARARRISGSEAWHSVLLAFGFIYAATDEWHQSFVPGRNPDPADWWADVAGVTVGYLLVTATGGRQPDKLKDVS